MIPGREAIVTEAVTAAEHQPPRSCIGFQLITATQVLPGSSVWGRTGQEQAPPMRPPPSAALFLSASIPALVAWITAHLAQNPAILWLPDPLRESLTPCLLALPGRGLIPRCSAPLISSDPHQHSCPQTHHVPACLGPEVGAPS